MGCLYWSLQFFTPLVGQQNGLGQWASSLQKPDWFWRIKKWPVKQKMNVYVLGILYTVEEQACLYAKKVKWKNRNKALQNIVIPLLSTYTSGHISCVSVSIELNWYTSTKFLVSDDLIQVCMFTVYVLIKQIFSTFNCSMVFCCTALLFITCILYFVVTSVTMFYVYCIVHFFSVFTCLHLSNCCDHVVKDNLLNLRT